jgi:hypothetical protein
VVGTESVNLPHNKIQQQKQVSQEAQISFQGTKISDFGYHEFWHPLNRGLALVYAAHRYLPIFIYLDLFPLPVWRRYLHNGLLRHCGTALSYQNPAFSF